MKNYDVWITKYGLNFCFYQFINSDIQNKSNFLDGKFNRFLNVKNKLGHRVILEFINSNPNPFTIGRIKQNGYHNYFIGKDPTKHATYVNLYKEIVVKEIYPGIDVRYYFHEGNLKYDFIVHPLADPKQIQFFLKGQYEDYTKSGNEIVFTTQLGEVFMKDLKSYQDGHWIQSSFVKQNDKWEIFLENYDKNKVLIIDPSILVYSTYIGGSSEDVGLSIKVNHAGEAYITGYTNSNDYDVTTGAFQTTPSWDYDVIVTKLNSIGSDLVFSTYLGGLGDDRGYDLALDVNGNVYVTGRTSSNDFDVTSGALKTFKSGIYDGFVTKLDPTGANLIYSTYIGGDGWDEAYGIAVDENGNAFITGRTDSNNFPSTSSAFQSTMDGLIDAFVSKLNPAGNALIYSTYLGGSNYDYGYAITIDASGNAYVTGETHSNDFDITSGSYQTSHGGYVDVFVTKLNSSGSSLVYSTFIGGNNFEVGNSIVVDASGNTYITGYTHSSNFDIVTGAYQPTHDGYVDAFVTKLNSNGNALVYSTFLGGGGLDEGNSIVVDGAGNAYITGVTYSSDFDITLNCTYQNIHGGGSYDVFVSKFNSSGSVLLFSTYLGGINGEIGFGIAIDNTNKIYVTGSTWSPDFDVTIGAFQTIHAGVSTDVFVSKFDPDAICSPLPIGTFTLSASYENQKVKLSWNNNSLIPIQTYVVQKWIDGAWNNIAEKLPTISHYEDNQQLQCANSTILYRIEAIDIQGNIFHSNVAEVQIAEQNLNFIVYPNPARNKIYIENLSKTEKEFEIINSIGQILYKERLLPGKNSFSYELTKGLYLVKDISTNQIVKLIVE